MLVGRKEIIRIVQIIQQETISREKVAIATKKLKVNLANFMKSGFWFDVFHVLLR